MSLFVSVLFSGCATVPPPNVEACARLFEGAACAYTIDGPDRDLSELEWLAINKGRISFAPKDWAEIRIFIESVCAYGWCDEKEAAQMLDKFEISLKINEGVE